MPKEGNISIFLYIFVQIFIPINDDKNHHPFLLFILLIKPLSCWIHAQIKKDKNSGSTVPKKL